MNTLAQKLEVILQKQQPVSSDVFWAQVEAFKDSPEPIQTSLHNSKDSKSGRPVVESLLVANG